VKSRFAYQFNSSKASFRDFSLSSKINDVSSANCDNLCSILFTFIPPIFLLPRILMAKISAHKIKRKSLNEALLELNWYAKLSGLNINFTKTQVIWIGSKKYSNDTLGQHRNLSWGKTSFKLLGINFDVDLDKHQYFYYPVS
jgi:hypothetical protein